MVKPDFTYREDFPLIRLYPETKQAEAIWNQIAMTYAGCVLDWQVWQDVRNQIRVAGYSVRKVRDAKARATKRDDEKLLSELLK